MGDEKPVLAALFLLLCEIHGLESLTLAFPNHTFLEDEYTPVQNEGQRNETNGIWSTPNNLQAFIIVWVAELTQASHENGNDESVDQISTQMIKEGQNWAR